MQMYPLGDSAIIVQFDNKITLDAHYRVRVLADRLQGHSFKGMLEFVPAFTTVTVYYNPLQFSYKEAYSALERIVSSLEATQIGAKKNKRRFFG